MLLQYPSKIIYVQLKWKSILQKLCTCSTVTSIVYRLQTVYLVLLVSNDLYASNGYDANEFCEISHLSLTVLGNIRPSN